MLRSRLRVPVAPAASLRRALCTPAPPVASRVQKIAEAHGGSAPSFSDLELKFKVRAPPGAAATCAAATCAAARRQVLSACEQELGFALTHADLNRIDSLDDAVRRFELQIEKAAEAEEEAAAHWTLNLPANVSIDRPPRKPLYNVHPNNPRHYKHPRNTGEARLAEEED